MRGDTPPDDCGQHIDCAWGCVGCPRGEAQGQRTYGYFPCSRCGAVAAYLDIDSTVYCGVCRGRFHRDFSGLVSRLKVRPDPPAEDT